MKNCFNKGTIAIYLLSPVLKIYSAKKGVFTWYLDT